MNRLPARTEKISASAKQKNSESKAIGAAHWEPVRWLDYVSFEYNQEPIRAPDITIFGIIAVSLDVGILNIFVFHAIWVRLHLDFNTLAFGHCVKFSSKKVTPPPKSEGTRTPMVKLIAMETSSSEYNDMLNQINFS